jgi:hypothetical protein
MGDSWSYRRASRALDWSSHKIKSLSTSWAMSRHALVSLQHRIPSLIDLRTSSNPLYDDAIVPRSESVRHKAHESTQKGVLEPVGGLRAFDTSPLVGSTLGYWVNEGLGLVVHVPSGYVAKINIP